MTNIRGAVKYGCAVVVCLLQTSVVLADDTDFPVVLGSSDTGILSTHAVGSQVPSRKVDTSNLLEHLKTGLFLSPSLSLQSELTYEPLRTAYRLPHKQHVFSDEGLYLEQLYGKMEYGYLLAYGGKFDVPVSLAADAAPGVFGGDYATDYQLREMLGFGSSARLSNPTVGSHTLGIVAFFADTSWLDAAAFTQPNFGSVDTARTGRLHLGNGGEANTGSPESFMASLDGDAAGLDVPQLTYHLTYTDLRHGLAVTTDQVDLVAAVQYSADLGEGFGLRPLVEAARLYHSGGSPVNASTLVPASQRADYLTTGIELLCNGWSFSVARAQRNFIEPTNGTGLDGRSTFERMLTGSIGYAFDSGLSVALAYKHDHSLAPLSELNGDTDSVGILVNYHLDF
jgi:hypothetical protein